MKKGKRTASFVDMILEAAQEQQDLENKEIFLTQVQSQSILPQIRAIDDLEYKKLLSKQKNIPYLISKHVRQAADRQKMGGALENTHFRHYEKQDLMEILHQKVKPSEKTLNYVVKFKDHKPSLELMKTVNRGLEKELLKQDQFSEEIAEETFKVFGMDNEDREDVGAMIQEEGDKIENEPREIKFTEHQTEFRNICSKVNNDKSAEIFLRFNDKYSQWNLKDRHAQIYFLSRASLKEPRDFIEKEIQEKMNQHYEDFVYKKPNEKYKLGSQVTPREESEEEGQQEDKEEYNHELNNDDDIRILDSEIFQDELGASTDANNILFGQKRNSVASIQNQKQAPISIKSINQQELLQSSDRQGEQELEEEDEDDEQKKFIFLEKLKYEKAIKGYDRVQGLKQTLFEFEDKLMDKLFSKREPTNEYKYILKKQNNISKQDKTKPMYLDHLKRLSKLQELKGKSGFHLKEITNENEYYESEQGLIQQDAAEEKLQQTQGKKQFKTKWYLPTSQWSQSISDTQRISANGIQNNNSEMPPIGNCTKQAIESFFKPYRELKKRTKEANLEDDYIEFMQRYNNTKEMSLWLRYTMTSLVDILQCPLITESAKSQLFQLEDDTNDYISKDDKPIFDVLKHYILPGILRQHLIEWLLDQFEEGILQSPELKGISDLSQIEKIEIILNEIGITNTPHMQGGTQQDLSKSIEGLNGTADSLQLLYRLTCLVVNAKQCETIGSEQVMAYSDKLMNYIDLHQNEVFKQHVRLFPPGFAKTEEYSDFNVDTLAELVDDLSNKVITIQSKVKDLNAESYYQNQSQLTLATQDNLKNLQKSLQELKSAIVTFNDSFEHSLKRDLSRVAQQEIQTQLGNKVEEALDEKKQFDQFTNGFQSMLEQLGKIGVIMQLAGLNPDNNYSKESQISNESILEMVAQVKTLKLSLAQILMASKKHQHKEEPKEIFIDENHDIYKDNPLNAMVAKFESENQADIKVLFRLYINIVKDKLQNFTVQEAFDSATILAQKVDSRTKGVDACKITFTKGMEGIDSGIMKFKIEKAAHHFFMPYFGYFMEPNQINFAYKLNKYYDKKVFKPLKSSMIGYKNKYDKSQSQYYFTQEFKPFYKEYIRTFLTYSQNARVIQPNVHESLFQTSLLFRFDFFPSLRPFVFESSFVDDPDKFAYFKISSKNRKNRVDTDHCSRTLMERALNSDILTSLKFGVKFNHTFDDDYLQNNLTIKASSELATNHNEHSFLKSKIFARYLFAFKSVQFYTSLRAGYLQNLRKDIKSNFDQLPVNDTFYLKNYKGIRNMGYYCQQNQLAHGIQGENLGFDKYLALSFKISQIPMPLFSALSMEPFVHANMALAPNRGADINQMNSIKELIANYGRLSLGFGVSMQRSGIALECYYNPISIRQKNELINEFQINIGID